MKKKHLFFIVIFFNGTTIIKLSQLPISFYVMFKYQMKINNFKAQSINKQKYIIYFK